eukprot:9990341-Alexandrium_andersonii.AAC.1
MDITKYEDFTDAGTVAVTLHRIRGVGGVLLHSSPCTGCSAWQQINHARALRAQNLSYIHRPVGHYDLRWMLRVGFERIARHCHAAGA